MSERPQWHCTDTHTEREREGGRAPGVLRERAFTQSTVYHLSCPLLPDGAVLLLAYPCAGTGGIAAWQLTAHGESSAHC
jgi:hypothetical protein